MGVLSGCQILSPPNTAKEALFLFYAVVVAADVPSKNAPAEADALLSIIS
jgi:hypothetical protein